MRCCVDMWIGASKIISAHAFPTPRGTYKCMQHNNTKNTKIPLENSAYPHPTKSERCNRILFLNVKFYLRKSHFYVLVVQMAITHTLTE